MNDEYFRLDAIAKNPTKYLALKHSVNKLKVRIANAQENVENLQANLEEFCPHNFKVEVQENTPGGYLNVATYRTDTYCNFCGKLMSRGETTYGGFA